MAAYTPYKLVIFVCPCDGWCPAKLVMLIPLTTSNNATDDTNIWPQHQKNMPFSVTNFTEYLRIGVIMGREYIKPKPEGRFKMAPAQRNWVDISDTYQTGNARNSQSVSGNDPSPYYLRLLRL